MWSGNMAQENSYVSIFKIDGKPILPPVIDDNRRIQLNQDRLLAMEVERRLQLKRSQRLDESQTDHNHRSMSDNDETLVKGAECSISNYDTSAAVDSLLDDNAFTLKEDEIAKTGREIEKMDISELADANGIDTKPKSSEVAPLSLTIDMNLNEFNADNLSPSFSIHSSPSLGALNESRNQSLYFTPMSGRESFSPAPSVGSQFSAARLIRSNSYTLEKPSPLLLKHMETNGIDMGSTSSPLKSPMSLNEFRKNQNNVITNIPRKSGQSLGGNAKVNQNLVKNFATANKSMSSISNTSLNSTIVPSNKHSNKSSSTKPMGVQHVSQKRKQFNQTDTSKSRETTLRSIYGSGKPAAVQNSAKKTISRPTVSSESIKNTSKSSQNESMLSNSFNGNISAQKYQDIFAMIEKQHTAQMEALVKRQQEEQKRMQEEFFRQQEDLLMKISNLVMNGGDKQSTPNGTANQTKDLAKKTNEKMLIDEVNDEVPVQLDSNGNRVKRFTPENARCIRRLYYDENKQVRDEVDIDNSIPSSLTTSTAPSEHLEPYSAEEARAVTTITAYMKGYLVRRLFKTTKVKTIRKTHYDTLELLLKMCEEKTENESKTDIELKFHLLQQLASASAELYNIFFEMPTYERMNIIAKDREWQQFKLSRSKSSDNNKTNPNHMLVNGNSARSQSSRFEKRF